ncbi:MAG: hypothetical protein ACLQFR_20055, partial [Streptosporangiaceae bacterium]
PAPPRVRQPGCRPVVFRIVPAAGSPRVLRDQFLLDELVELVQVDVTEDRGRPAALCAVPGYAQRWPAGPGKSRIGE